jgi:hypothetical protein
MSNATLHRLERGDASANLRVEIDLDGPASGEAGAETLAPACTAGNDRQLKGAAPPMACRQLSEAPMHSVNLL